MNKVLIVSSKPEEEPTADLIKYFEQADWEVEIASPNQAGTRGTQFDYVIVDDIIDMRNRVPTIATDNAESMSLSAVEPAPQTKTSYKGPRKNKGKRGSAQWKAHNRSHP